MKEELKQELIKEAINKLDNPWKNLTVKDVSKDLKMGENLTNELFKRADFPSINIGKTKTITAIAYALWKLEKRMPEYKKNRGYIERVGSDRKGYWKINNKNFTVSKFIKLFQIFYSTL